ncbi:hypothetical protein OPV22_005496 [Ensete ventricosum]|uniref:Uncharacterized protein n=1 Tax=Ensete ventricosum TaxID=4639 RepID=A0AAV8RCY0_ENSVE|nr:hypothetical protein OPV22_005496 [Ensete ventricosum]
MAAAVDVSDTVGCRQVIGEANRNMFLMADNQAAAVNVDDNSAAEHVCHALLQLFGSSFLVTPEASFSPVL